MSSKADTRFSGWCCSSEWPVVVVGSLTLLLALDLVTEEAGATRRSRNLLIFGLVGGLGWWISPIRVRLTTLRVLPPG